MRTFTLRSSRLRTLAATLGAIAVSMVVAAPQASADTPVLTGRQACNYDGVSYYACHIIDPSPAAFFYYDDFALPHVNMPQQYASEIVACGAHFSASLWGNDGGGGIDSEDDFIVNLTQDPGWPRADWSGLEAHFSALTLSSSKLDELDGGRVDYYYAGA
jgi:hypothetical protein